MRVLYATSECAPWCKTGGLADVSAALPAALRAEGLDAQLLMPLYAGLKLEGLTEVCALPALAQLPPARVLRGRLPSGVAALLVDSPALYARAGGPYQDASGADWEDNALRFAQLGRAAAALAAAPGFDVIHCNDWQSALALVYLRHAPQGSAQERPPAAGVLTIHNLAFQGLFEPGVVAAVGLPPASYGIDGLEFYGRCSFLKGGIACADAISTVSPSYAREIQQEEGGMGLHGLLAHRRDVLRGILNGIDEAAWDPRSDPLIESRYGSGSLECKADNKRALQRELGLAEEDVLLAGMVCRLTEQKGVDLLLGAAPALLEGGAQLAVLGRGEEKYERALQALAAAHPGRVAVALAFDDRLAHRIEAGADAFLMPSRFEPCGMNQMYSQRYGTVPVVRATGGLIDTVVDASDEAGEGAGGAGFVFREADAAAFAQAIGRLRKAYADPARWRALQRNGMARDFGWAASARAYRALYEEAIATASARARSGA